LRQNLWKQFLLAANLSNKRLCLQVAKRKEMFFVSQTFAESTWDCIVCVVVPSEEVSLFLILHRVSLIIFGVSKVLRVALNDFKSSFAELCASKAAESVVLESMHSVGLQNGISAFEMPRF
jgi:hypothetical protein